jgi:hypothetical protein
VAAPACCGVYHRARVRAIRWLMRATLAETQQNGDSILIWAVGRRRGEYYIAPNGQTVMRFERHGGPPDLEAAFRALISSRLRGRVLDDNQDIEASQGRFPDFSCFRDIVLIEMKHLKTDQQDRINDVIDKKLDPTEKPFFYGSRESHFIVDAASNSEAINAAISSKLARSIEGLLHSADAQIKSYRSRNERKNSIGICVILNSSLREWSPDVVAHAIHSKMKVNGRNLASNSSMLFCTSQRST